MTTNPPSPEQILQVGLGFWASKALLSAVEMEVSPNCPGEQRIWRRCAAAWDCIHDRREIFSTP